MSKKEIIIILCVAIFIIVTSIVIGVIFKNSNKEEPTQKEYSVNFSKDSEISQYLPDDITTIQIKILSQNRSIMLMDIDRINNFLKLFTDATWTEDFNDYSNLETYWEIKVNGTTVTTFNLLGTNKDNEDFGIIQVICDDITKIYKLSISDYLSILSFPQIPTTSYEE